MNFRFHTKKLLISNQIELKFSCSSIIKNITSITMTTEEKDLEFETIHSELHTLTWLHKNTPCFTLRGSEVNV